MSICFVFCFDHQLRMLAARRAIHRTRTSEITYGPPRPAPAAFEMRDALVTQQMQFAHRLFLYDEPPRERWLSV
jgi:hypothetical protein